MSLALSSRVGRAFYDTRGLREAQQAAVEPIVGGRDTLVIAGTGSGKTEAVVAPVVDRYLDALMNGLGPVVLYLTPTRALANDLLARLERPLDELHVRLGVQHGERKDLARKARPTILITTPESMDNMLVAVDMPLRDVRAVVIDEVHQLAGTQRGLQVKHLICRLERSTGTSVQVAAMSATVADPLGVWRRVRESEPFIIEVPDARRRNYVLRRDSTEEGLAAFFERLSTPRKALAFCNSRRESEQLGALLRQRGVFDRRVFVHHSSLDRKERLHVEEQLRSPERAVCVATSTLELGIDIGDVDLVVLCGPPADWRSFSQRLGRGNRRSNEVDVLCLVPPWSKRPVWDAAVFTSLVWQMEGRAAKESDDAELFGATSQQIVSYLRGAPEWQGKRDLVPALGGFCANAIDDVADALVEHDLLQRHPVRPRWGLSTGYEEAEKRQEVWGNFPASSQQLRLVHNGRLLGEIPFGNGLKLEPGKTFAFQGRVWRVVRLVRRDLQVLPGTGKPEVPLTFGALGARLDPTLVELIPTALSDGDVFKAGPSTASWWDAAREHLRPSLQSGIPVWREGVEVAHATFAGRLVNEAVISLAGASGVATESTIRTSSQIDFSALPPFGNAWLAAVSDFLENPAELTPWQQRLPAHLLREELVGPFLSHPAYRRIVERLRSSEVLRAADDRLSALEPEPRR